jgi:hypothetical protein
VNIEIHIDRLVLEGLNVPHHQHALLQTSLESELSRLVSEGSLGFGLLAAGSIPSLSGEAIQLHESLDPQKLGQQIAQVVYTGINR